MSNASQLGPLQDVREMPSGEAYVAIYMRPSHRGKWSELQGIDLQRWSELKRWADQAGHLVRWYKDVWDVTNPVRAEWDTLINDITSGCIGTVVCWRLDRLGLSCTELVEFFEFLSEHNVNLISLKDHFDLSTPAGRKIAGVIGSIAIYESELRADRIVEGQEAARARGIRWGGSEKGRRLTVTPEREAEVKKLRAEGKTISLIARITGLSRPTIYKILGPVNPDLGDGRHHNADKPNGKSNLRSES
jgi:DNA invertase Pin-like site-specific DNA recombinase